MDYTGIYHHLPDKQCYHLVLSVLANVLVLRSRSCGYFFGSFVLSLFSNKLIFENNTFLLQVMFQSESYILKTCMPLCLHTVLFSVIESF